MKKSIIGSTQYKDKFVELKRRLISEGHEVKTPAFDDHPECATELDIVKYNLSIIKWADEVHVIWDSRSIMTISDFHMCIALDKIVIIEYIESKEIRNIFFQYEEECKKRNSDQITFLPELYKEEE